MKKWNDVFNSKSLDFVSIQIALSIIAISFAAMLSHASASATQFQLDSSILPIAGQEFNP